MSKPLNADHVLLKLPVLLSEGVKVDGAPDARPLAANHDDRGGIHGQEDPGAASAVRRVPNGFSNGCEKETELYDLFSHMMKTVGFAWGPDFKAGFTLDDIEIVDIYQIMAFLLKIPPNNHDGNWNR